MPFKKGGTKKGGRKKGSTNKKTTDNRERVNNVLSWLHEEHLYEDLKEASGSERIKTYIALMEYSLPKLQRIAHEGKEDATIKVQMDLSNLTDDELTNLQNIVANATSDKGREGEA